MSTKPTGIPNGSVRALFETFANLEVNECIEWPRSRNGRGYGQVWIDGKVRTVHSVVCERHHGPRPTGHHAAHHCGNKACMNYRHIRWATPTENEADKHHQGVYIRRTRDRRMAAADGAEWIAAQMKTNGWATVGDAIKATQPSAT